MTMLVGSLSANAALIGCLSNLLDKLHFVRLTEVQMEDRADAVMSEAGSLAQALLASDEEQVHRCLDQQFDRELSMLASRSEEHTSELQSLMRISYAVFCLKKKQKNKT